MSPLPKLTAPLPQLLLLTLLLLLACLGGPAARVAAFSYTFHDATPVCFIEDITETPAALTGAFKLVDGGTSEEMSLQIRYPTGTIAKTITLTCARGIEVPFLWQVESGGGNKNNNDPALHGRYQLCLTPIGNHMTRKRSQFNHVPDGGPRFEVRVDHDADYLAGGHTANAGGSSATAPKRRKIGGLEVLSVRGRDGTATSLLRKASYLQGVQKELDAARREMDEILDRMRYTSRREKRMRMTSESTFSRVWLCAVLLMAAMSGVIYVQFRLLKRTMKEKKLI